MVRPRLFELLDAGVQGPLTLLTGPAGSGKTVLLSSWVATAALSSPVAWVSLDAADNDPARFWSYLLAALRQSGAAPPSGRLGSFGLPIGGPDRGFVLRLAAELAELEQPVIVVLDDIHEVTNPAVLDGLATVLHRRPTPLRLLLTTRDDPPLPLARPRVAGQLTEVRAPELAFTAAEAAELPAGHGLVLTGTGPMPTCGWPSRSPPTCPSGGDHGSRSPWPPFACTRRGCGAIWTRLCWLAGRCCQGGVPGWRTWPARMRCGHWRC